MEPLVIFKFTFGNVNSLSNKIKDWTAFEGVDQFYSVLINSFKKAIKKASHSLGENHNIISKQLSHLISLERQEILSFFDATFTGEHSVQEILKDDNIVYQSVVQFFELIEKKYDAIDKDLASSILENSLKFYREEIFKQLSEKQGIYILLNSYFEIEELLMRIGRDLTELITSQHETQNQKLDWIINSIQKAEDEKLLKEINPIIIDEYDSAKELLEKNDYDSAIRSFKKVLDLLDRFDKSNIDLRCRIYQNLSYCLGRINSLSESNSYLIKMHQLQPENAAAILYGMYAYHSSSNYTKRDELYTKLIEEHLEKKEAFIAKVFFTWNDHKYELEEVLKKDLKDEYLSDIEVQYAIALAYLHKDDLKNYEKYILNAIKLNPKDSAFSKKVLAFNLSAKRASFFSNLGSRIYTKEEIELLNKAIKYYLESWAEYKSNSQHFSNIDILINISTIYEALKDYQNAISYIDKAIAFDDSDYIRAHKALYLYSLGDEIQVHEIFSSLEDLMSEKLEPFLMLYVNILLDEGEDEKFNKAQKIIRDRIDLLANPDLDNNWVFINFLISYDTNNLESARGIYYRYKGNNEKSLRLYFIEYCLLDLEHKKYEAKDKLRTAIGFSANVNDELMLFEFAKYLKKIGEFEESIKIFEKILTKNLKFYAVYDELINLYYKTSKLDEVLNLCEQFRITFGITKRYLEEEIHILLYNREYANAQNLLEQYLDHFPDENKYKIELAVIYLSNECLEKLKKIDLNIDLRSIDLNLFRKLYKIKFELKDQKWLSSALYNLWKIDKSREACELILHIDSFSFKASPQEVNLKKSKNHSMVLLMNENNRKQEYIIYDYANADIFNHSEVNSNNELYKKLVGRKIGDKIQFGNNFYTNEPKYSEVIAINSLHIYAQKKALELISTKYSGVSSIVEFNYPSPEEGVNAILELIEKTKPQHLTNVKLINQLIDKYTTRSLPIGILESYLQHSIITIWHSFTSDPNIGIVCFDGDFKDFEIAHKIIHEPLKPICVDITSLLTLYYSGISDQIINLLGKFKITQSTVDVIKEFIYNQNNNPLSHNDLLVYKNDGKNIRHRITVAQEKELRSNINDILEWTNKYCELPEVSRNKLRTTQEEQESSRKIMGISSYDSILLCKENSYVLLTDDYVVRKISQNDYKVRSLWTHILLLYLRDLIKKETAYRMKLNSAILKLHEYNYHFLPVSSNSIILDSVKDEKKFNVILHILKKTKLQEDKGISFTTVIITTLAIFKLPLELKKNRIYQTLDTFIKDSENDLFESLKNHMKHKFKDMPIWQIVGKHMDKWWELRIIRSMKK